MGIEYKKEGKIATIIINHPESSNALKVKDFEELHNALVALRDDDTVLVGIITGSGNKAFCGGVDIKDFLPSQKKIAAKPWLLPGTIIRRLDIWKPIIAAVNGVALGGGSELALACDIRIASTDAIFAQPEVTLGVFPGGGSTQRLPRLIPQGLAMEMLLTGKRIKADEAYRIGLVNKVVPPEQVLPEAKVLAESICRAGPLAVQATKESIIRGYNLTLEEGLRLEEKFSQFISSTQDYTEGIQSFIEKRPPEFKGI